MAECSTSSSGFESIKVYPLDGIYIAAERVFFTAERQFKGALYPAHAWF